MTFPTKGENHSNGIKNEKDIVDYMNKNPDNLIIKDLERRNNSKIKSFKHEGGSKQKMDASFDLENGKVKGVSIKHHDTGTFDWVNTTQGIPENLKSEIEDFKQRKKKNSCLDNEKNTAIPKKGGIRNDLDNIFSNYLDKLTSKDITELLSKIYRTEENTDTIIINNKKTNQLIMIPESNLDQYCCSNKGLEFILKSSKRARTSRQIWIKDVDGIKINTNMRIRLHLNNGITALLGYSEKNKSSVPCLKIQQDNVDKFISECVDKVIIKY